MLQKQNLNLTIQVHSSCYFTSTWIEDVTNQYNADLFLFIGSLWSDANTGETMWDLQLLKFFDGPPA